MSDDVISRIADARVIAIHREATLEAVNAARARMRPPLRPITDDELYTLVEDS